MTTMTLQIDNPSVMPVLKKLIGFIDGVSIVRPMRAIRTRRSAVKAETDEVCYPELDRAMEDVREGRVHTYSSAAEMFKQQGI